MKKHNHPANVVDVSSRIMGLLGRRKVDPTTEAMRTLKPDFDVSVLTAGIEQPDEVYVLPLDPPKRLPLHLQHNSNFIRPDLREYKQFCGRIERQPGLTHDERQRWIDVLERMLSNGNA